jgi:UDP-2,3-diacylglucosamine hydrolase
MRICVISDLHYKYSTHKPDDIEQNARAQAFLRSICGHYDWLILNGDIFDLWYDWQSVIVKAYFPVLKLLADIQERGCRIVYISGNHDFWFNGFLPEYLQIELHQDAFVLETDRKKIYFTHGDLHTTNDLRYHFFRKLIRMPFAKYLFNFLHPDMALGIGRMMSRSSRLRRIPHRLQELKKAGLEAYARSLMPEYDFVLMGHTHEPCIIEMEGGIYANSGDWVKHSTYLTIINGDLKLNIFTL